METRDASAARLTAAVAAAVASEPMVYLTVADGSGPAVPQPLP